MAALPALPALEPSRVSVNVYRLLRPGLRFIDPERGHRAAIQALRFGLAPKYGQADDPVLAAEVFGLKFPNPVGLAAGFDKDAEVLDAALALGFGFVEAGTVTPKPQPGNPKPRLFRLDEDDAVINSYGFNSRGLALFVAQLQGRARVGIVGANVGKNKESTDATADFVAGVHATCAHADYIVVNVSSPNTPGLRALQARAQINEILDAVVAARNGVIRVKKARPPLLVKVAPDLDDAALVDIAEVSLASGIDGIIMGNTTITRPSLRSAHRERPGGLSGRPLLALANERLAALARITRGRVPLVGSGGVSSGADAYAKIRAGASLVQLYSALVFHGPSLVGTIKIELAQRLRADGFKSVADAVGADLR